MYSLQIVVPGDRAHYTGETPSVGQRVFFFNGNVEEKSPNYKVGKRE